MEEELKIRLLAQIVRELHYMNFYDFNDSDVGFRGLLDDVDEFLDRS